MCKFCESLINRDKKIIWNVRSTYADDNICEFVNDNNCSLCKGCNMHFEIYGYNHDEDVRVGVSYTQNLVSTNGQNVEISPFSELMQFNFCPVCGEKISKNLLDFDKYSNILSIVDDKE